MTDPRRPWWYSGDEPESGGADRPGAAEPVNEADADEADADEAPAESVDWGHLLAGAFRMVDWATTAVMAPHAEHANPAEHPQCVVCRGILLVGTQRPGEPAPTADVGETKARSAITWIPIDDPRDSG